MSKLEINERIINLLEDLTGRRRPQDCLNENLLENQIFDALNQKNISIGFSQFNEILLSFGYDRLEYDFFFQFLIDGSTDYISDSSLNSLDQLEKGIDRFRIFALILYGNIRYGYKELKRNKEGLDEVIKLFEIIKEEDFVNRNEPIHLIEKISALETYYLGYLMDNETNKRKDEIRNIGKRNYQSYLASDHLDVYIATSMRAKQEFYHVNKFSEEIFNHSELKHLKLRVFDPTQAFCEDRIDKGLFEALMLKRARCTIYLVQENDSFGKDSELASTLAQGKPVIAFIPQVDENYFSVWFSSLKQIDPNKSDMEIIIDQLRIFDPDYAWKDDSNLVKWRKQQSISDINEAKDVLFKSMRDHYNNRADTISDKHPLGMQVYLKTGVANGVLLVRDIDKCAKLIRNVVTDNLSFYLEEEEKVEGKYLFLREKISECVFRVQTGDALLTNTFWNYYLD